MSKCISKGFNLSFPYSTSSSSSLLTTKIIGIAPSFLLMYALFHPFFLSYAVPFYLLNWKRFSHFTFQDTHTHTHKRRRRRRCGVVASREGPGRAHRKLWEHSELTKTTTTTTTTFYTIPDPRTQERRGGKRPWLWWRWRRRQWMESVSAHILFYTLQCRH